MSEREAFERFIGEADEDVIRNDAYEEAARLGWEAAMRYADSLDEPIWEYGVAAYGDMGDVIRFPEEEIAREHLQAEYGDKIVRRIAVGAWEEVA